MSDPLKELANEVVRDFEPLVTFLKSSEIFRGEQNEFDEPVIGDFTKYVSRYGFDERIRNVARKTLLKMIANALDIDMNEISDLDFTVDSSDPRLIFMYLDLSDETNISIPLIDRSVTLDEF